MHILTDGRVVSNGVDVLLWLSFNIEHSGDPAMLDFAMNISGMSGDDVVVQVEYGRSFNFESVAADLVDMWDLYPDIGDVGVSLVATQFKSMFDKLFLVDIEV